MANNLNLLGISDELDDIIVDFAYLTDRYKEFHPGNSGDVSQMLDPAICRKLDKKNILKPTEWFEISELNKLANIRNDGRTGYRAEGIKYKPYFKIIKPLANRLMLITRTGADLPSLSYMINLKLNGKLFNIIEIDSTSTKVRIMYGNHQCGSIPSIELHMHLLSNAISISQKMQNPATLHAHPYNFISIGSCKQVHGSFCKLNKHINKYNEGLNRNYLNSVGIVPYFPSGSEELVKASIGILTKYELILWMNHGCVIRSKNIRDCYTLAAYADNSAKFALEALRYDNLPAKFT